MAAGMSGPWAFWNTREIMRVQDRCLLDIEAGTPLVADCLNALPPWRAVLLAVIAAKTGESMQLRNVESIRARARLAGGDAGPGWLTGGRFLACSGCGRVVFEEEQVREGEFSHSGPCGFPRRPDRRHVVQEIGGGMVMLQADEASMYGPGRSCR